MKVLNDGRFSVTLDSSKLIKGIRTHNNQPRNSESFIELKGVIGKDGTLQRKNQSDYSWIYGGSIESSNFPWPQFFRLDKHYICCNQTSILEWKSGGFTTMISGLFPSPFPWWVASSSDWVYFSNGFQAVVRDPETNTYAVDSSAPVAFGICNYNGQIIVGDQTFA